MQRNLKFYLKLFRVTFLLSAFTFGGGYVIVSLMKKQFVDDYQWFEENEMLDMIAIAQSSPGAIAINAAVIVGYQLAGWLGVITTVFATVLPPFAIISIIAHFYQTFIENQWIAWMLEGMQAGVAAVIVSVVYNMVKDLVKKKEKYLILIFLLALLLVSYFNFPVSWLIVFSLCCGVIYSFLKR
ncbi:chromate transporter [Facklamia miroungae]|uniref:Chromate transporter n=1 Tax=Facklamia miroungae TaxID=120956 RepID=A0A1G7TJJ8_9LACT|nr:chromate transporter [Facklamia miroungae]NKZ29814.1 chromate transporter [Facklamia miroungae]SDG35381.1 chromate transporter [Facklamia miroungae]